MSPNTPPKRQCIQCKNAALKSTSREAVKNGFVNCTRQPKHQLYSLIYPRECCDFRSAAPEIAQKRVLWMQNRAV